MTLTKKRLFASLAVLLLMIAMFFTGFSSVMAQAETYEYTGVTEDLSKDGTFSFEDYPAKDDDYSLQVVQIAESVNKELFVYVYQPCGLTMPLTATSINISTAINDSLYYQNYKLSLLDRQGVFGKYRVDGLTVKNDALRYYDISSIFRAWDETIDEPAEDGNTIQEVSYNVGKLYSASTVDGIVTYDCITTETILITDKHVGYLRYNNGFFLSRFEKCDSHYVAFSTDHRIDKLLEAEVYFVSQDFMSRHNNGTGTDTGESGEKVEQYVSLTYTDVASNPADGLFGKKYEWNRIESVEDFIAKEDLTDETLASLDGKEWVLRFYETEWKQLYNDWYTEWQWTHVSEVSILRLKFETAGKVYNLGVVDNKQTGDNSPDNNNTNEYDFGNWGALNWLKYVLMIVAAVILILLLSPVLPYIVQAVVWVVMLPFKGIAALVNAIKKAATKKPKTTANSPTNAVKAPQPKTVYVKSDKPKQGKEKQNK